MTPLAGTLQLQKCCENFRTLKARIVKRGLKYMFITVKVIIKAIVIIIVIVIVIIIVLLP